MIRIHVTNNCPTPRVWCVEPYGDEVHLEVGAVLSIEFENPTDLTIDVALRPGAEVIWTYAGPDDANILLPDDLKVDGSSLWPSRPETD